MLWLLIWLQNIYIHLSNSPTTSANMTLFTENITSMVAIHDKKAYYYFNETEQLTGAIKMKTLKELMSIVAEKESKYGIQGRAMFVAGCLKAPSFAPVLREALECGGIRHSLNRDVAEKILTGLDVTRSQGELLAEDLLKKYSVVVLLTKAGVK